MSGPRAASWVKAGEKHFAKLLEFGTFGEFVAVKDMPARTKTVRGGDVLTTKRSSEDRWRMVIKGFLMQPGIHYNETFAPVVHITTLRILLVMATKQDWDDWQGDATSAIMLPGHDRHGDLPHAYSGVPPLQPEAARHGGCARPR